MRQPPLDAFDALRRLYSAADDKPRVWWYASEMFATPEGWPTLHLLSMRAILACRSRLMTPDEMEIEFVEIGAFVDPGTHRPAAPDWTNPITGLPAKLPTRIFDGYGRYRVRRTAQGVEMLIVGGQQAAVQLRYREDGPAAMVEYERDRTVPGGAAFYKQSMFGDRRALADRRNVSIPAQGAYISGASLLPAYAGFGSLKGEVRTRGSLRKADLGVTLNPETVRRIQPLYPEWFPNGAYQPIWTPPKP